ncbi:tRNA lysidine(34) synthetase TilS [Aequorivita sp. H23M31]|uniref:tRNA(Ile)-lysidine synthase n=1 Tax=Aequorivita ciconiae TaxID=2494375 RepID=A0A410G6Q2_9FLAO|nr:tRNA lysidine(34) synthetase TilS [Aequorivita sp. H23M31]QAA82964.1 tRNA lysidine(34) synthetase TilS [Aequorivita sp. H23M31]
MFLKFKENITENFNFLSGKKLLIACSGGIDSVVLGHLIKSLDFEMALAHCNFSLRGKESDGDEMFVIGMAKNMEIPIFAETFDTKAFAKKNGISTQMAARTLRYDWFQEILQNFNYDYLLTAHHLDDDLETFFINLSRGTGINGLTGIPPKNGKTIRPLLSFTRDEIESYAQKNGLKWRDDSSNQKPDYLRNKLRLEVLPFFKEINDSVLKNFKKTQRNLQSSKLLIEDYMSLIYNLVVSENDGFYRIDIQKLKDLPNVEALLYELLQGFGFAEWEDVFSLMDAQTGKQVFSKTHKLLKNRDELLLSVIDSDNAVDDFFVPKEGVDFPIKLKIEPIEYVGETEKNLIYVSAEKLNFPLTIRRWREGDSFQPFGLKGKKKLSKFFKDEKISLFEKDRIWLLLSDEKIVWVIGHRMDDRFKVDDNTQDILKITHLSS